MLCKGKRSENHSTVLMLMSSGAAQSKGLRMQVQECCDSEAGHHATKPLMRIKMIRMIRITGARMRMRMITGMRRKGLKSVS